jgi:hypothetical protein
MEQQPQELKEEQRFLTQLELVQQRVLFEGQVLPLQWQEEVGPH